MALINSSINSNVSLAGDTAVTLRKISFLPRCSMPRSLHRPTFALQKHMPPLSTSIRLLPQFLRPTTHILSAAPGTEVAAEEEVEPKSSSESSSPSKPKRSRPGRKSKMPPVKNEQLVPGATFKGIVLSIQPFGAFVDFGAFTDGLVHVSRLSDSFVKDVANVVTVGQEVSVRLIEANMETGRISLTMRDSDDPAKAQQQEKQNDSSKFVQEKQSESRKFVQEKQSDSRKFVQKRESSKFMKGQDLEGTVKNLTRAGAFISLPEEEEGFLPTSEEAKEGFRNMMGGSSLEVGQEVSVRVLRVSRGQVTLTLKEEEDMEELDVCLTQGVVHTATNPFVIAFRGSQLISAFLDENKKADGLAKEAEVVIREGAKYDGKEEGVENKAEGEISGEAALVDEVAEDVLDSMVKDEERSKKVDDGAFSAAQESESQISGDFPLTDKTARKVGEPHVSLPHVSEESEEFVEDVTEEVAESVLDKNENQCDEQEEPAALNSYGNGTVDNSEAEIISEDLETKSTAAISTAIVKQLREETGAGMMDCKNALMQNGGDIVKAQEYLRKKGLASADKKSSKVTAEGRIGAYIHDSRIGVLIEVNCETDFVARGDIFKNLVEDLAMQVAACSQVQHLNTEDVPKEIVNKEREIEMRKEDLLSKPEQIRSKIVDGRIRKRLEQLALLEQPFIKDDKVVVKDWVKQSISTIGENIKVKRFVRYSLGEGLERRSLDFVAEVAAQTASKSVSTSDKQEEPVAATSAEAGAKETVEPRKVVVSAASVKELREESGAGMMDCKKALSETGGDPERAKDYLQKKGLLTSDTKSGRAATEGRIGAYIHHDSRTGALVEVNCETDFVGRSEKLKELVDDLAMQAAACPNVQYVSVEDIPASVVRREKELEMAREELGLRPEEAREKMVEGRVMKRLGELALLEQPFIKNDGLLVKDLMKQTVAAVGENVKVRRFVRFTLGET